MMASNMYRSPLLALWTDAGGRLCVAENSQSEWLVETLETDGTNGNITNRNSARMTPARFGSNSGFLICSFHRRMMAHDRIRNCCLGNQYSFKNGWDHFWYRNCRFGTKRSFSQNRVSNSTKWFRKGAIVSPCEDCAENSSKSMRFSKCPLSSTQHSILPVQHPILCNLQFCVCNLRFRLQHPLSALHVFSVRRICDNFCAPSTCSNRDGFKTYLCSNPVRTQKVAFFQRMFPRKAPDSCESAWRHENKSSGTSVQETFRNTTKEKNVKDLVQDYETARTEQTQIRCSEIDRVHFPISLHCVPLLPPYLRAFLGLECAFLLISGGKTQKNAKKIYVFESKQLKNHCKSSAQT